MPEVVAAFLQNENGEFLICRRPAHKARGLKWEFPGGKIEIGETPEAALARECREEMDIEIRCEGEYMALTHVYPELSVHLRLLRCRIAHGTPKQIEHCDMRWIRLSEADAYDFCDADRRFIERMKAERT